MYKGVAGVFLLHLCLVLGVSFWVAYFTGMRFPSIPRLTFYTVGLSLYAGHCYVFIRLRYGITYERAFRTFDRRRQICLLSAAWLLVAASLGFMVLSASYLRSHFAAHQ